MRRRSPRLSADELCAKLEPGLKEFGDAGMLSARVRQFLDSEAYGGAREIAVALVGVGVTADLERMQEFLGRFKMSIDVVSFEVFELAGGPRLLIREVTEEHADAPSRPRPERSVEAIRQRAAAERVLEPFDRFIGMSEDASLFVRPYTLSVMVTPPGHHGRVLMYATPRAGGIHINAGPDAFAEFFDVSEQEAVDALDPGNVDQFLTGEALDARIEQIRKFLKEKLPGLRLPGSAWGVKSLTCTNLGSVAYPWRDTRRAEFGPAATDCGSARRPRTASRGVDATRARRQGPATSE